MVLWNPCVYQIPSVMTVQAPVSVLHMGARVHFPRPFVVIVFILRIGGTDGIS